MALNDSKTTPRKSKDENANTRPFPYPACWQGDNERVDVLLAPFRLRDLNPENYDAKMKFWQDIIAQYCDHKGEANFNKRELQLMFAHGSKIPYGLDTVLEQMQRSKKIRPRAEYEYDPENSWTGWAINSFVKKPLSWSLVKLKTTVGFNYETQQGLLEYIHVEVMKQFCNDLQTKVLQQQQGKLLHYHAFKDIVAEAMQLTEDCLQLCLHKLNCQRKVGLEYKYEVEERQIHLVKIPSTTNTNVTITEADRATHNLQMTQTNLLKQLDELEVDIKFNDEKARQYLKENKRQMAKTYLRKKHLLEKNHEKRSIALHNIETLLCSVEEAQSNGDILDAYKIGSKALQSALNESGLKYDNVDEIISEVRETIETHNEVQDALANANLPDSTLGSYDNDELEKELKEIMGETEGTKPKLVADETPNKNNNKRVQVTAGGSQTPRKIEITDAELLAMLQDLEVEEDSPTKSHSPQISNIKMQ